MGRINTGLYGGGSTSTSDGDDAGDDGTADNEFETDEDTLSAGDMAGDLTTDDSTSTSSDSGSGSDGTGLVVEDTSDPDSTSPAGGQGLTGATADFTGVDRDRLDGANEEQLRDLASETSDTYTQLSRATGNPLSFLEYTTSGRAVEDVGQAVNKVANGNLGALEEREVLILGALGLGGVALYQRGGA